MQKLLKTIYERVIKSHDYQSCEDLYYMSKEAMKTDIHLGVEYLKLLSTECEKTILNPVLSTEQVQKLYII